MRKDENWLPQVLLVTTWFPTEKLPMSGIFVQRDVIALSEIATVKIIHLTQSDEYSTLTKESQDGVEVLRIPYKMQNPITIFKAAKLLRPYLQNADLLHTHAMSTLIPLSMARVRIPWVHTEHWSGYVEWNAGVKNFIRKIMGKLAKKPKVLVAVSSVLGEALTRLSGRDVAVIPNIVEYAELQERRIFNFDRPLEIIAVGNLIARKRPLLAAKTCEVLNQQGIETNLTWIGKGPLEASLIEYCQEHNVSLHLPGILQSEEVVIAYSTADVSIFPTAAETFGLVGAEALAAGRPLVAGSNGGQRDFVSPPAGLLVDSDSPVDYANAILKVLEDTRSMSAEEIAEPIRTRFSAQTLAEKYRAIYAQLLGT